MLFFFSTLKQTLRMSRNGGHQAMGIEGPGALISLGSLRSLRGGCHTASPYLDPTQKRAARSSYRSSANEICRRGSARQRAFSRAGCHTRIGSRPSGDIHYESACQDVCTASFSYTRGEIGTQLSTSQTMSTKAEGLWQFQRLLAF